MSVKFTDQFVRNLKPAPPGRRITHWDSLATGLCIRITDKGARSFSYRYRTIGGRKNEKRRLTIGSYPGMSLVQARKLAREARVQVLAGVDPLAEKQRRVEAARRERSESIIFGDFSTDYIRRYVDVELAENSARITRGMLKNHILPRWRNRRLIDLGKGDVATLLAEVRANASKGKHARAGGVTQTNRVRSRLGHMFTWAIEEEVAGLTVNPVKLTKRIDDEKARKRPLKKDAEIRAFWRALDHIQPAEALLFRCMLLTGARGGECRRMRWQDIDTEVIIDPSDKKKAQIEVPWWTVPAIFMKGKKAGPHGVPLVPEMVRLLGRLPKASEGWVHGSGGPSEVPLVNYNAEFQKAHKIAEIGDLRPHDLRSTVASGIVRLGFSPDIADAVLAHIVGSKISRTYVDHGYEYQKWEALVAWAREMTRITARLEQVA